MKRIALALLTATIIATHAGAASATDFASICTDLSNSMDNHTATMMGNSAHMDVITAQYPYAIRGTTPMMNPMTGQVMEMPYGYQQNWTNGMGNYIQTNDLFYNPNMMPGPVFVPMVPYLGY